MTKQELYEVVDFNNEVSKGCYEIIAKYTNLGSARRYVTNFLKEKYGKYKSRSLTTFEHKIRIIHMVWDEKEEDYISHGYCN